MSQFKSKAILLAELPLAQRRTVLCSIRPSTDWMRPTLMAEDNLLYSKSTDLNVNLIQKQPHRNIQNSVWPNIWVSRLVKLMHKINKHRLPVILN